jgi:hypothetical protein
MTPSMFLHSDVAGTHPQERPIGIKHSGAYSTSYSLRSRASSFELSKRMHGTSEHMQRLMLVKRAVQADACDWSLRCAGRKETNKSSGSTRQRGII